MRSDVGYFMSMDHVEKLLGLKNQLEEVAERVMMSRCYQTCPYDKCKWEPGSQPQTTTGNTAALEYIAEKRKYIEEIKAMPSTTVTCDLVLGLLDEIDKRLNAGDK